MGGTGGTCPLQTNGRQKLSDRVGFVSLAGYIAKCTKTCMKKHKIAYVNDQKSLDPAGELTAPPKPTSRLGSGVSLCRLWRLKSNVPLPKQFSGSAPESIYTFTAPRTWRGNPRRMRNINNRASFVVDFLMRGISCFSVKLVTSAWTFKMLTTTTQYISAIYNIAT